ncbi:hypothetical protein [Psychrobacter submarinus]|uniref:hypothetical protein n=1 Tax=Psychrobacter submarinus TaxID=154108 RepID=UPI001D129603|nr:hypothetical protein [Psychrobacter submarinus]
MSGSGAVCLDKEPYRDACLAAGVEVDTKNLNKPLTGEAQSAELNAIKRELFPICWEVTKCRSAGGNHAVG